MNKEILIKYLENKCSEEEFDIFTKWIEEQKSTEDSKKWISDHWKEFEPVVQKEEEKYNTLLDKIHHKINLKDKKNDNTNVIFLSKVAKWVSRVAAILFIPLLGVLFYLLSNNNIKIEELADIKMDSIEVIAPIGSQTVVQLSDGTEVTLNYGSKIKYPRNFKGNTREVALIGEGYFDVTHNPEKPFIVKTGKLNIKALGTEFNVLAYPGEDIISTTLVEGKVAIEKVLPNKTVEEIRSLIPGQHITYNLNTDKINSSEGNIDKFIAWKDGRMVFDNAPISEVTKELSRKFNVDIEIADNIKSLTYTVTFIDDPIFLILDLMTETTPITYKQFSRTKLPDGTFSKQKIRIEKRE